MGRLRICIVLPACFALYACDDGPRLMPDARTADASSAPDGIPGCEPPLFLTSCNPLANIGCPNGQKCTWIFNCPDPGLARISCVPDGDVPESDTCSWGEPGTEDGYDDCSGGLLCVDGSCARICSVAPDTCLDDGVCERLIDSFGGPESAGVCQPSCDPLAPSCALPEGCYLLLASGKGQCMQPETEDDGLSGPGTQGAVCSQLNACASGYGCLGRSSPSPPSQKVCAYHCDAAGSGGPACADGPGPDFSCRSAALFYGFNAAPEEIGFCLDPDLWGCRGCIDASQPGCDVCP